VKIDKLRLAKAKRTLKELKEVKVTRQRRFDEAGLYFRMAQRKLDDVNHKMEALQTYVESLKRGVKLNETKITYLSLRGARYRKVHITKGHSKEITRDVT